MYLQLKNVDELKEREIISYFVRHPFLTWVVTSTGKWSIIMDVISRNLVHLNAIVDELKEKYGEFFGEYKIASEIDYRYFHSKYYGFKERTGKSQTNHVYEMDKTDMKLLELLSDNAPKYYGFKERTGKSQTNHVYEMDKTDMKLLELLSDNARSDYVTLSNLLQLTANTIKNRLNKLVSAGIIKSFFAAPNKTLLCLEQYNIQFVFEHQSKVQEKKLIDYLIYHPNVHFYYKPVGHWDLEVGVFVENPGKLRKIILDFRNRFPEIKIYDTVLFYEEHKSNVVPAGVFQVLTNNRLSSFRSN